MIPSFAVRLACSAAAALLFAAVPAAAQENVVPGMSPDNSPPCAPRAPDWAYPQSPTHNQVGPPNGFHRATKIIDRPIGIFDGQADVGAAVVPGSASFADGAYRVTSAGYNVWYTRDEFRYLWKRMSGDVSLAADISFPDPNGYEDRKAVLIIRQSLDDDAPEALVALHGGGMFHLAERPARGQRIRDMEYRIGSRGGLPGGKSPDSLVTLHVQRIGIEKKGDQFTLWVSEQGEPMHQYGAPVTLHLDAPFYVGIGFVSHLPTVADTAVLSRVVLENKAGKVR